MDNNSTAEEEKQSAAKLPGARRAIADSLTRPVVRVLARTPLSPDMITWLGFLVAVGAAVLIITGHLFAAGLVMLFASFFDILDGALARITGRTSRFGAVLDSTLDRMAEAALLLAILVVYAREQSVAGVIIVGLALVGSMLVSYIRARAEALDIECQVGIFTRAERVVMLALGLLLSRFNYVLITALAVIVVFSFITVFQRLFHVWRKTKN